jgi:hypothetical protein
MNEPLDRVGRHLPADELDRVIAGEPLAPETQQHLRSCEDCRWLADQLAPLPFHSRVPAAWTSKIRGAIGESIEPSAPLTSDWRLTTRLLLLGGTVVVVLVLWLGWHGWRFMDLVQRGMLSISLLIAASVAAVSLVRQMIPGERKLPLWAMLGAVFALPIGVSALAFPWTFERNFAPMGLGCLQLGICAAAAGAPFFLLFARMGVALSRPALGFTIGALSGLVAVIVLRFHCPSTHAPHLLLWHCTPLLAAACAGWLIGRLSSHRSALRP